MNEQIKSQSRQVEAVSPNCADPNCLSCKQLREMHERIRTGKLPLQPRRVA